MDTWSDAPGSVVAIGDGRAHGGTGPGFRNRGPAKQADDGLSQEHVMTAHQAMEADRGEQFLVHFFKMNGPRSASRATGNPRSGRIRG